MIPKCDVSCHTHWLEIIEIPFGWISWGHFFLSSRWIYFPFDCNSIYFKQLLMERLQENQNHSENEQVASVGRRPFWLPQKPKPSRWRERTPHSTWPRALYDYYKMTSKWINKCSEFWKNQFSSERFKLNPFPENFFFQVWKHICS